MLRDAQRLHNAAKTFERKFTEPPPKETGALPKKEPRKKKTVVTKKEKFDAEMIKKLGKKLFIELFSLQTKFKL